MAKLDGTQPSDVWKVPTHKALPGTPTCKTEPEASTVDKLAPKPLQLHLCSEDLTALGPTQQAPGTTCPRHHSAGPRPQPPLRVSASPLHMWRDWLRGGKSRPSSCPPQHGTRGQGSAEAGLHPARSPDRHPGLSPHRCLGSCQGRGPQLCSISTEAPGRLQ